MKLFVWDFHGTLEKGNEYVVLEISNIILEQHGYSERVSEQHCKDLYGKKWYEYFEFLLPHEPNERHFDLQEAYATDAHIKNKTKIDIVKRYLSKKTFDQVITIGDSPGDVELGKNIEAKTFLYTHPGQEFKDCDPHFRINDLREVLSQI